MSYSQSRNALLAQKPEYVLKRANDLINSAIGNNADKEKRMALEQLHAHIASRGKKSQSSTWSKVYETLMKRHLELCVDLKDDRTAKDGLHQYRNLCQAVDPASLELVVVHLMDLAEQKALAARTKANKVALAAAAKVSDLDQEETPESIMLSSMTEEGHRDRTDREVVVPWLKFLWEIYRATLDLLNKNAKLERVYHKTCEKAFNFCKDFERTLEFRRLCEMLRTHLASLQKTTTPAPVIPGRAVRQPWEWTPESIELHLQTRFAQLEVASSLELWNEGFRTVEDIYAIMQIGGQKKSTKPRVMAAYYEKLTRIFLVSDNHLFHAYCWFRYYTLTVDSKKQSEMPATDKKVMASAVLLAALCIPSIKESGIMDPNTIPVILDDEEIAHEKNQRMAMLLDFQANPTRHALLQDIVSRGILNEVLPGLSNLYTALECKFTPLTLAAQIAEGIALVKATPQLAHYAVPLQRVAVLRVVLQLSRVYASVKVDFVRKLLAPLSDVPYTQIERVMVDGVARKQLHLRIDHAAGCLRFGSLVTASTIVESGVATFGATVSKLSDNAHKAIAPPSAANQSADDRRVYIAEVAKCVDKEHAALVDRKRIIELRKEGLERQHAIAAEKTRISVEEQEARRKVAENKRLEEEARQREEENKRKAEEKLAVMKFQKDLARYNISMTDEEVAQMTVEARLGVIREAKAKEQASKDEAGRRVNEQARKLDHITRALRIEAAEIIGQKYAEQVERDRIAHEAAWRASEEERRKKHALELVDKERYARMHAHRTAFEGPLLALQKETFEREQAKKIQKDIKEIREKRIARARQRHNEEIEREQEEREAEQQRIEDERRELERLEQETAEKLRLQREADEAAERAIFEAEQRRKREEEKAARLLAAPPSQQGAASEGGAGGGWQAARAAREAGGPAPAGGGSGLARFAASTGGAPGGWGSRGDSARDGGAAAGPGASEGAGRWGASREGPRPGFGAPPGERREGGGFGGERREGGGFGGERREGGGFGGRGDGPPRRDGPRDQQPRGPGGADESSSWRGKK